MSITLWQYYQNLAETITSRALQGINSLDDWNKRRPELHRQFMVSMGLDPLPPRGDLNVREFGSFTGKGYRAVKLAYDILPDCSITGTLYFPDPLPPGRHPAVLYVCGHAGIGLLGYQAHAILWARRGYICLLIDTLEQHDNLGTHHGLYYRDRYDWISMGYTAAGGELWSCMRAMDLLAAVPEVDPARIGCTGISGGGALSFYLAIADERVKAAASACGVTLPHYTLAHRHVQTHCDCIYYHNRFQKDTCDYAALVAPRPLLFCFAAADSLFSVDEFRRLTERTRRVYRLFGREADCNLCEYPGQHGYQPVSVAAVNRWFDTHVAGAPHPDAALAPLEHGEAAVTVFNGAPPPTNKIWLLPEPLTRRGSFPLPQNPSEWATIRESAKESLRANVFSSLPSMNETLTMQTIGLWREGRQGEYSHSAYCGAIGGMDVWVAVHTRTRDSGKVLVAVAGAGETARSLFARMHSFAEDHTIIAIEPRGSGLSSHHPAMEWDLLRAGAMTGLTPTMVTIQDLRLMMPWIRELPEVKGRDVYLYGRSDTGVAALYHGIFDDSLKGVIAEDIPATHLRGGHILGILPVCDLDHAAGLQAPRPVGLVNQPSSRNMWASRVFQRLQCADRYVAGTSLQSAIDRVMRFG